VCVYAPGPCKVAERKQVDVALPLGVMPGDEARQHARVRRERAVRHERHAHARLRPHAELLQHAHVRMPAADEHDVFDGRSRRRRVHRGEAEKTIIQSNRYIYLEVILPSTSATVHKIH
jgi:hypothetical protein